MSSGVLIQMVHYRLGIGILPSAAISPLPPGTVERRFSDLDLDLSIGLAINPEIAVSGSALDSLASAIKNHFDAAR